MKKLISIILAIMMLAGIVTVSVAEEEAQAAFTGSMSLCGTTEAAPGEQVLLRAIVADANLAYTVTWQTYNAGEEKWVKASEGNDYSFAAPGAGSYTYRAHLKAEDDTVIDREITLTVIAPEPVKEPEPAPAPAPVTEPETAPVVEEAPVAEEAPVMKEALVVEEAPVVEETPVVEEAPVAEEAPAEETAPVVEEAHVEETVTEEAVPVEEGETADEGGAKDAVPAVEDETEEGEKAEESEFSKESIPAEEEAIPSEKLENEETDQSPENDTNDSEIDVNPAENTDLNSTEDEAFHVNVREEPNGLSVIIATLTEGAEVNVVSVDGDWVTVLVNGEVGYIYYDDCAEFLDMDAEEPAGEKETAATSKKVTIFTSCRDVMEEGEAVVLTSKLEGFENCEAIRYIWKVDKGNGYEEIEEADEATYTFPATMESLSWSWHLTVICY